MTMEKQKIEAIARSVVIVGEAAAQAARRLREALVAFEEATIREAICRIEEDENRDPFAELLQVMEEIRERCLLDELAAFAEDPADIETPRKVPRPPKRLGPVNKANFTASRPPKRARSSCYRCRH